MNTNDTKRISRLTAIVTQLHTKRLVTASELAAKFSVSIRTIYRDIRALEQAGIPIYIEEGKGYSLMEHYRLPSVMFAESEANALIVAEQLVINNKDSSLIADYSAAITSGRLRQRQNQICLNSKYQRQSQFTYRSDTVQPDREYRTNE